MGVGAKLAKLLREKQTNVHEVSVATGISPSTLYSLIQRDSVSANIHDLSVLARYLGVGMDYFGAGSGQKADGACDTGRQLLTASELELVKCLRSVDAAGLEIVLQVAALESQRSAGRAGSLGPFGIPADADDCVGFLVPDSQDLERGLAGLRCIVASDASMLPLYKQGDIVVLDPDAQVERGDCGLFRLENRTLFRQLASEELRPLNPSHPSSPFASGRRPLCLGKAVGSVRRTGAGSP